MRTKLFFAFLFVILIALVSNLLFERLIMNDFDEYIRGTGEDHLYWVLASIEGSYQDNNWNMNSLTESVHWGMMLGFDLRIEDKEGKEITSSIEVMDSLPLSMRRRMGDILHSHSAEGAYEKYPLYIEGKELGALYVRPIVKEGSIKIKETIFKERGMNFLIISFLIAGLSALAMAFFFSLYLSRPMRKLKLAAERIAERDFSVRVSPGARDEIGRLSESFNYMAEALEKEEALRKRLASNIAHELRTPLAVMKAQVEGMIDGVVESLPEGFENIRGEVERLTRLVEGIEDLTKAEASFFSRGEQVRVNLKEFLKGVESSMRPIFHEKMLEFSILDRGDVEAVTDVEKLERILKNIISNSLKYTERGGITVDYGREDGEFFIEVRDTGMGIPEEDLPNIFMRFYRGRVKTGNGIGVGLAIVKELVDVMGGKIEVKSPAGEGTIFKIYLPTARE